MIHELRIYRAAPGKMPALLERFENLVLRYWKKYDIQPLAFWRTEIGPSHLDLYHILQWQSLEERARKWAAFSSDAQWLAELKETERDGVIVASLSNVILTPTRFSPLQ